MECVIEKMNKGDWSQVSEIYKQGIETNIATFQDKVPSWDEWNANHIESCRFVAKSGDSVLGWVALSATSSRAVYKGVAEVSIYISNEHKLNGIGTKLLDKVIYESEENGFWTLQSGIISTNIPSIELHKKCGFRVLGIREKIAKINGDIWMDVVIMERRSKVVGIN